MTYVSIGDMSRSYMLRHHNVDLQKQLTSLGQELATGVRSDIAAAVSGDFRALAGIEHSLGLLDGYKTAATEAALFASGLQTALGTVQDLAAEIAPALASVGTTGGAHVVATTAADARQKFDSAVSALNTRIADQYLLSGTATDQRPLAGPDAILGALGVAVSGQTTAAGVASAVDAWFHAPPGGGGFTDIAYGGAGAPGAIAIGEGDEVSLDVTALDPALVDTLEGMALAALVAGGVLPGDDAGRADLMRRAGEALLGSEADLAALRGRVGTVENHIAGSVERNAARASAFGLARNAILAADPYETATALAAVQTQIETLYSVTARLSRLTLADYLK